MDYLFITGRVPSLSKHELEVVLSRHKINFTIENLTSDFLLVKTTSEITKEIFLELGGFTKFGKLQRQLKSLDNITETVAELIKERNFGLSLIGNLPHKLPLSVKKLSRSKRYVFQKNQVLSAAQSKGIRQELLILEHKNSYWIFEILGVQNIDEYTLRDRYLPQAHGARGMLPPKLARIMVNLAIEDNRQITIYDPFCGTGRVLMEALLLGQKIMGSDIDPDAIRATQENLTWLKTKFKIDQTLDLTHDLFVSAIKDIKNHLEPGSCEAIVTEPYLGPPQTSKISSEEQDQLFTSIKEIYLDLLEQAKIVLKPGGILVTVFPVINEVSLGELFVDILTKLGYITIHKDKVSRDKQIIGREIVKLRIK